MSYYAIICNLKNVREHPNADRIKLATLFGNQVVVGLDSYDGQRGIYFPTDGQLSEDFCKANDLVRRKDPETGETKGGFFDENRRVRTQKFRGEKSDGFWIPIESLEFIGFDLNKFEDGFQFTEIGGIEICRKYISPATKGKRGTSKNRTRKTKNPMFKEHFDTDQYAYNKHKIPKYALLHFTEKVHGTSHRIINCKMERELKWYEKIVNYIFPIKNYTWTNLSGTRRVELNDFENFKGFYGGNEFRKQWHDLLSGNLKKGETIYFEIVGWVDEKTPIMPICDNKKLNDKEFTKRYGRTTTFSYGCSTGKSDIFVYRITLTNEDGYTVDLPWSAVKRRCGELGIKYVPEVHSSLFINFLSDDEKEKALEQLDKIVETSCTGESLIDSLHIREGVVVRCENNGENIYCLKHKSFEFKVLEGISKDSGVVDIEEAEDGLNDSQ